MDDQFNARTDDDLFLDDFEPVVPEAVQVVAAPKSPQTPSEAPASVPQPSPTEADSRPSNPTPRKAAAPRAPPPSTRGHDSRPRGQLGQSRHAPPASAPSPRGGRNQRGRGGGGIGKPHVHAIPPTTKPDATEVSTGTAGAAAAAAAPPPPSSTAEESSKSADATDAAEADPDNLAPPPNASTGPAAAAAPAVKPASVTSEARLKSGANPRTKLTDDQLSAKMAAMAVASAEKMRRHNQAQRDERDHEIAMERSAEDARKRRAADQEKRRQADEDRRRLEDERAKNRERKLKAMGAKDGAWEQEAQQEDTRAAFTGGANGGVRGVKNFHQGSRHSAGDGEDATEDRNNYNQRGGRGGGGRGRGRGGDFGGGSRNGQKAPKPALNNEAEFPPLSTSSALKPPAVEIAKQTDAPTKMFSPLSPSARWDDEVEAEDERAKASGQPAA